MTPEDSHSYLENIINDSMSIKEMLQAFIDFYSSTEIDNCPKSKDDDMLLFQYSCHGDFCPFTSLNLTRQYTFYNAGEYSHMAQLKMDILLKEKDITFKSGNFWLESNSIQEFTSKVFASEAYTKLHNLKPMDIFIDYGQV